MTIGGAIEVVETVTDFAAMERAGTEMREKRARLGRVARAGQALPLRSGHICEVPDEAT